MDHPFLPSLTDSAKCNKCKLNQLMHTNMAECETCDHIGSVEMLGDIAICNECMVKELAAAKAYQAPKLQEARHDVYVNEQLNRVKTIDQQVQLRTDIFNAETVAIVEIKALIDSDESITNKPYALASMLTERYLHFKKVIFDLGEQQVEKQNQQRAIQTYLNTLADKLRIEEREKLKISDINYQPSAPKLTISKPKARKSFDKVELAKYAGEVGLPLATFQMLCVQRNLSPELMAASFKKVTDEVMTPASQLNELTNTNTE